MTQSTPEESRTRFAILDVFGISLEVSNPRLAELLTMDAADALTSDVRDLIGADRRAVTEALPDSMVALPTPHSEAVSRERREFRARADEFGTELGFTIEPDGTWASATGIDIVTRIVERPLTVAAAAHYVNEVAAVTDRLPDSSAVLFVVGGQQTADVFKVAIRQRRVYNLMRTVSLGSLEELAGLARSGRLDHRNVLVLLAPIANIDVGEILSVLHAEEQSSGTEPSEV
jgi:hypothetical protein